MKISQAFWALKRRWYITVAIVVLAVTVAIVLDKGLAKAPKGTATVQLLVDSPVSSLVNLQSNSAGLESRASVLAQAMTSNAVVDAIAKAAGVPADEVTAQDPFSGAGEGLDVATPSEARGMQIVSVTPQYRLTIVAQQNIPIVTVSVQGPTPTASGDFANRVLGGTEAWLASLNTTGELRAGSTVRLRQLGDAQAGVVNSSAGKIVALAEAVGVLLLGFLGIVLTDDELRSRRRRERDRAKRMLAEALELETTSDLGTIRLAHDGGVFDGDPRAGAGRPGSGADMRRRNGSSASGAAASAHVNGSHADAPVGGRENGAGAVNGSVLLDSSESAHPARGVRREQGTGRTVRQIAAKQGSKRAATPRRRKPGER